MKTTKTGSAFRGLIKGDRVPASPLALYKRGGLLINWRIRTHLASSPGHPRIFVADSDDDKPGKPGDEANTNKLWD